MRINLLFCSLNNLAEVQYTRTISPVQLLHRVWLFATPWQQHIRPPCLSPTPRVCTNSCPLDRWCHPTTSSSTVPFSCLQSFPASGSFPMSQLFASGGRSIGASALAQSFQWIFRVDFLFDWLDLLAVQGTLKSLLQHHSSKASILQCSAFFRSNSHIHTWLLEKPYLWLDGLLSAE